MLPFPAYAATWENVLSKAGDNLALQRSKKNVEISRLQYQKAINGLFPNISANVSANQTPIGGGNSYGMGISATQYLFKGFQNYYSIRSAYSAYELSYASYLGSCSNIYLQARQKYIDLLTAQESLKLQSSILARRKENARMLQLRNNGGIENKGNLLVTQANQTEAQHQLSSAKRSIKLAVLALSQFVNATIESIDEGMTTDAVADIDLEKTIENAPNYSVLKKQLEIADIGRTSKISGWLPTVALSASMGKTGNHRSCQASG